MIRGLRGYRFFLGESEPRLLFRGGGDKELLRYGILNVGTFDNRRALGTEGLGTFRN